MKTFKAKHNKGFYKNTNAWLDAIYRNNKDVINKELSWAGSPKKIFKQMINEYIAEGKSPTKAVSTLAKSTLFTTEAERLRNNALGALKGDKGAYKAFREYTKQGGKYTAFDESKLRWDKSEGVYTYGKDIVISFQNSPYGVEVKRV